jgi:hypothetical protein
MPQTQTATRAVVRDAWPVERFDTRKQCAGYRVRDPVYGAGIVERRGRRPPALAVGAMARRPHGSLAAGRGNVAKVASMAGASTLSFVLLRFFVFRKTKR